jgi:hypothetical protein
MKRFAMILIGVGCVVVASASTSVAEKKPDLGFTQAGDALVVTMTVEIDNAPHVLWTHVVIHTNEIDMGPPVGVAGRIGKPEVVLYYYVFQNRDDPGLWDATRKTTRQIQVAWRLAGHQRDDEIYTVRRDVVPSARELKALVPRLRKLAEEGEKRLRSGEFIP